MAREKIDGVLLLDKPKGISSNAALQTVKYLLQAKKAGHTGSLDPNASGMLPICFGEATKYSQYLLDTDKVYTCDAVLGATSTTGDCEGDIDESGDVSGIDLNAIRNVLPQFTGDISQVPTMYSALKHHGQPLYRLARRGIEVEREARAIRIYQLECVSYQAPIAEFFVACSKGTYIRTLIEDIGQALGCGGYVKELRRQSVGHFREQAMVSLDQLRADPNPRAHLLPVEAALHNYPLLEISESHYLKLAQGQVVDDHHQPTALVRLQVVGGPFIGLGEVSPTGLTAKRLMATHHLTAS